MSTDGADRFPRCAEPLALGGLTLRNRLVRTAHGTGFARNGLVSERLLEYHERRARGGVAATILEIASVHESSIGPLAAYNDAIIGSWEELARRCHAHGMAVLQQLWHGGAHARARGGAPAWSPSGIPSPTWSTSSLHNPFVGGQVPLTMSRGMIADIVIAFGAAARRAERAGLDGVEVHGGHGYLVCQFLSALTNRRDDEYGGGLEQRTRFLTEVLREIRASVSAGFVVGVRLAPEECPGGLTAGEVNRVARCVAGAGLVDFVDLSLGGYYRADRLIAAMHEPLGYELPTSVPAGAALPVPRIVAGRILSLDQAEGILERGEADLVSMVRATIADPDLVAKSLAGAASRVRPCISCNQACQGGLQGPGGHIRCTVNPVLGREPVWAAAAPSRRPGEVVVVGAGPAGLAAAHEAAAQGHQVTVYESLDEPGGIVRVASSGPTRGRLMAVCDWLHADAVRAGACFRFGTPFDETTAQRHQGAQFVIATGARRDNPFVQRARPDIEVDGLKLPHVHRVDEVLRAMPRPASAGRAAALLFDDIGAYPGANGAEALLAAGWNVTVVTPLNSVFGELTPSLQLEPTLRRLKATGRFRGIPRAALAAVAEGSATVIDLDTESPETVPADLVVLVASPAPNAELRDRLVSAGHRCDLVGDALTPRDIEFALQTGHTVIERMSSG